MIWCALCCLSPLLKMKILIIADDECVRKALAFFVRHFGWESQACDQYADIVALLGNPGIDVVLLDHRMLGIDGLEIARNIRDHKIRVPVVLMSPIVDSVRHDAIESLQISKVVSKPPSLNELRTAIEEAFRASSVAID